MTDATPAPRRDGRNARATRTRKAIIAATRALMLAGNFRPTVALIAQTAGVAVRSVFQHFDGVEAVHAAALDISTRKAIAVLVMPADWPPISPDADCIVHAAVFGQPMPTPEL